MYFVALACDLELTFCIILASFVAPFWILLIPFCSIFGVQNRPWGCPRRFRKTGREQKRAGAGNNHANGSKMEPRNRKVGGIFNDCFEAFPASFVVWILNGCLVGFCSYFYIHFMLHLDAFGYILETS